MRNWIIPLLRPFQHQPWPRSTSVVTRLDPGQLVEEENSPYFDPRHFYPARLGDVLNNRYQLATKLGHGSSSTVWLARDLAQWKWLRERYVTIKIQATTRTTAYQAAPGELNILKHISQTNWRGLSWTLIRQLLDSFTIPGKCGLHICLVFEPLREPLWLYQRRLVGEVLPEEVLKMIVQMALHGLDYLHSDCHIIHTDLKPDNIMVKLEDQSILEDDAKDEFNHPLPQKHCDDGRVIYLARNNYGPLRRGVGVIRICDFDLAVLGDTPHKGCIQGEIYRAPEVILDAGYTYSADIWSLGVMLWDLLEGKALFKIGEPEQGQVYKHDEHKHLAYITALLGDAPQSLLNRGDRTSLFYDEKGRLQRPDLVPSGFSFGTTLTSASGQEKKMLVDFVRRMIRWDPKERSTARELLQDPWLDTGIVIE